MKKTNKKIHLYKPSWGWYRGFNRRVYVDENGTEYVKMRGWTKLDWVIEKSDWYSIEHE